MMWALLLTIAIIAIFLLCLISTKIYNKMNSPRSGCYNCMVRKIVVVTGCNRGMGFQVALDFAQRGARVILACRKKDKAEEARLAIIKATNNTDVVVKHLNLASFRSIRTFAYEMLKTENRIDVLVNNAGTMRANAFTEDGLHATLQVNALGPFLLTYLLIDLLKSTANGRVVNVATLEGTKFSDSIPDFVDKKDSLCSYWTNYSNSKKCLVLLMTEMAQRLRYTNVGVNVSLPRNCATEIQVFENLPDFLKTIKRRLMLVYRSPEESCQNTIFCALSESLASKSGGIYRDCKEYEAKAEDIDILNIRKQNWSKCVDLVKLKLHEMTI